ncbi:MAG: M24 family metallopeptidase [Erythrobacter sp.]
MTLTRRNALTGIAAAGAGLSVTACATASNQAKASASLNADNGRFNPPIAADRPIIFDGLLLNKARAMAVMEEAKVDLLFCRNLTNIYYLTSFRPIGLLLGNGGGIDFAALSAHGDPKPTLISSSFALYFGGLQPDHAAELNIKQFSLPVDFEGYGALTDPQAIARAPAFPPFLPSVSDHHPLTDSEEYRRALASMDPAEMAASTEAAILREILANPLPNKTIAIDDLRLRSVVEKAGLDVRIVDGDRLLRRIRVQKSPAELKMMRYAATSNAASGRAAALSVRNGATFHDLRSEFHRQAGSRGMNYQYMMIDNIIPDKAGGEFAEGRSFLIDCVSTFEGYHGDYGRTVCVGEPTREMQTVIDGLATTWDRLRSEIKVGMDYNSIRALGLELFKDIPIDTGLALNPHSCGLNHSDDAGSVDFGTGFGLPNGTLEENMVLSIDLPFLDNGFGGSAHLEDLVIMTKDGPELINDSSDRFILV